jgi:hypothetical protein
MKNQKTSLQTTMERRKRPIGQPKLQPHMTLQSLGKHIKQENEEGTRNQESKKCRRGTWEKQGSKDIHVFGLIIRGKLLLQYSLQPMEVLCFYKSFLHDQQRDVFPKIV